MSEQGFIVQIGSDGVAVVTLNRPERLNALSHALLVDLRGQLQELEADTDVRVIVLTGAGRAFSAGADLAWMQQAAGLDYNANLNDARELAELMYNLNGLKIPTLAVVQGAAFGGAVGLVSCCDMAIGARVRHRSNKAVS